MFATDDFFAPAENLLKDAEPIWKEGCYTEFGKWMDGWETRRKRSPGHDWTILRMNAFCEIKGVCVDTSYFTGNFAPRFSITAANIDNDHEVLQNRNSRLGTEATAAEYGKVQFLKSEDWTTLIPMTQLSPGYPETRKHYFPVDSTETWNYLRLNLFPDGGVARLRVYGIVRPKWLGLTGNFLDLAARENGTVCLAYSNAHYGHPRNLIKPGKPVGMLDGWETARRLDRPYIIPSTGQIPGEEWAIFKLGCHGIVQQIIVDTTYFKGNYPDTITIKAADDDVPEANWTTILQKQRLAMDKVHFFTPATITGGLTRVADRVKIIIAPDGGFARLRLLGNRVEKSIGK